MNTLSKLFAGVLLFIFLFYNLEPGLNVSLFALAIWLLTYFGHSKKDHDTFFWILSISCAVSIFSFAWYGDEISFFALFISLITTVLYAQYPKVNFIVYPVIMAVNLVTFPFRIFFFRYWLPQSLSKTGWRKWIVTGIIPVLFLMIFALVYATGSDLFSNFFKNIFLDFNLIQIILLAVLSFFILFNLWCLWLPRILIKVNSELENDFRETSGKSILPSFSIPDKQLQRKGGEVTFILLNALLLLFIISYNYEQFFVPGTNSSLSDEIHQRIATVIISILMAIGLILFYFKSKINLRAEGKLLKNLSVIWLLLNALLVISAFIKNGEYILSYGLTFKRISVFIFLVVCLIGLSFSWYKIAFQKTNVFLINRMAWTLFFTFVITAPINFSSIVTKYNISNNKEIDAEYLQRLPYNKSILYQHFGDNPEWRDYFNREKKALKHEKNKPFLSSILYYRLLKFD